VPNPIPLSISNEILHLILLPTEACNFRCVYCYEEFKYRRMEPRVIRGVKALLERRAPGLRSLTISWFGGEPLLARTAIEDVMQHARSISESHPLLKVSSDMTTNGFLLSEPVLEKLCDVGVTAYQISFDGLGKWHDRKRVLAGGKGTFDRIWGNLLAARGIDREFRITVRVHVDQENAQSIPMFIDAFARDFGPDARFTLFIRGLSRLGGGNDAHLRVFEPDQGRQVIDSLRALARARGVRVLQPEQDDAMCYAAKANSFVVRANGRLNKCTVALEHSSNHVGDLHEDGSVSIRPEKMMPWMRGVWSMKPAELKCPMKGLADPAAS